MALSDAAPLLLPKMEENMDFFAGLRRSRLGCTTGGAW
jgi:hypothetical protein